jgi:anti-sigma factor RsiW
MPHINEEQLSAYLDGQLDAGGNGLVEMHLRECESCRGLVEEMREVTKLFRSAERLEPSPFLWTRIAAGFEHETMERSWKRGWGASVLAGMRRFGWNSGIAATAFGILMFVGITILKEPNINPVALV